MTRTSSVTNNYLYQRFELDEIPEPECKAEIRFNKNDIPVLAEALELPEHSFVPRGLLLTSWKIFACCLGEQHTLVVTAISSQDLVVQFLSSA